MNDEFIPYACQSINATDTEQVAQALGSKFITRGPLVENFESAVARYCGSEYAVAFNSGSSALLAACHAAKINQFDRLISTPNTFVATIGSAVQCGAVPTFVDIDQETGNLNLEQVAYTLEKPYSRGRPIIMPVHFSGIAVDVEAIDNQLKDPDAVIIEDACHAFGSHYSNGDRVGCCSHSQMTIFSFHPAKTLTTGEGGMVTTNDEKLYNALKRFRNNGIERDLDDTRRYYYEVKELTCNYNFTEFQAALGLSQLERVDTFIDKRRELISHYRKLLKGIPHLTMFTDRYDKNTAFHLAVVQIDFAAYRTTREKVMEALFNKGIGTQVHYIPVYEHPYFKTMCGNIAEYFPNMETYFTQALSLPLYYDLTFEQVERVVSTLQEILKGSRHNKRNRRYRK